MLDVSVQQEFLSAGVNRVVGALAWSDNGTVAFGAHHMVVLYDHKSAEMVATLIGHSGLVGCVAWVPPQLLHGHVAADEELLVSGAADGELCVWSVRGGGRGAQPWRLLAVLKGHTGPVTGLAFHADHSLSTMGTGDRFLMVSTAGDSDMRVWACQPQPTSVAEGGEGNAPAAHAYKQDAWGCTGTLPVGTQMQHCVALTHLPGHPHWLVLVSGGCDSRLHIYLRGPGETSFKAALKLPGHDGWVRSLAVHHVGGEGAAPELLIATASQDRYGRIWRLCAETGPNAPGPLANGTANADDPLDAIMRYAPRPGFEAAGECFSVTLESLLIGHEDWVHTVCWQPTAKATTGGSRASLCLLTASMDRTMMLWTYEAGSGLWLSVASVGDAGATCLGYFGGVFNRDGSCIMAHGFTGAIHLWERQARTETASTRSVGTWVPRHAQGGHWDAVTGVTWGCDGGCVMSVSEDQTARIFTDVTVAQDVDSGGVRTHWCEIARPQVHGHDFSCLASLPHGTKGASYAYVSGSEEKVLRVMEGTQAFIDTLGSLRAQSTTAGDAKLRASAFGAAVSALGLTNRMVLEEGATEARNAGVGSGMPGGNYDEGPDFVPNSTPSVVREPPLEEHLAQNTLWPEAYKLYGHGDMIYCCAASPDGAYLASACVAKSEQQAAVWIWDIQGGNWKAAAQLKAHTLTVTQLAWSHSSDLLASCSRDRTFSVFRRIAPADPSTPAPTFQLIHRQKAAHTRVLWGVSWSHDDCYLATGARDNQVKLWRVTRTQAAANGNNDASTSNGGSGHTGDVTVSSQPALTLPAFPAAVTAVAWAPCSVSSQGASVGRESQSRYLLAVGLESGHVQVWSVCQSEGSVSGQCVWVSGVFDTCAAQVSALAWRTEMQGLPRGCLQLAVGSHDHSVRVLRVTLG